jgi:murein DD-endopeptidase MepM/ murein hydrolase activator NlpD
MPDAKAPDRLPTLGAMDDGLLDERTEATQRASRAERQQGGLATSITQAAPDVWLLPHRNYSLSSSFGWRWGRMHNGVDLAASHGSPVQAVHAGTVVLSRWYAGYGYAVIIDHGDGVETLYGHNSELLVLEGQEVRAGEVIARVGNTGYSFGAHVHLEVHINGVPQDPIPWLQEHGVDLVEQTEEIYGE